MLASASSLTEYSIRGAIVYLHSPVNRYLISYSFVLVTHAAGIKKLATECHTREKYHSENMYIVNNSTYICWQVKSHIWVKSWRCMQASQSLQSIVKREFIEIPVTLLGADILDISICAKLFCNKNVLFSTYGRNSSYKYIISYRI